MKRKSLTKTLIFLIGCGLSTLQVMAQENEVNLFPEKLDYTNKALARGLFDLDYADIENKMLCCCFRAASAGVAVSQPSAWGR